MSVTIETIITCDGAFPGCEGNDWSADSRHETAKEQRKKARRDRGWRYRKGEDYCAHCWLILKTKEFK
jgi:hypothetical protein